jgi:16S rRNA processing protein RimM
MKKFIETGKIVNTHGVRGQIKLEPWSDDAAFICGLKRLFISDREYEIAECKIHRSLVILTLEGVSDLDAAIRLKNKIAYIDRDDVSLPAGEHFIQDLIGLQAIDSNTGAPVGKISDVLSLPAHKVYVISGEREILIPAVDEFVKEIDVDGGFILFNVAEGL